MFEGGAGTKNTFKNQKNTSKTSRQTNFWGGFREPFFGVWFSGQKSPGHSRFGWVSWPIKDDLERFATLANADCYCSIYLKWRFHRGNSFLISVLKLILLVPSPPPTKKKKEVHQRNFLWTKKLYPQFSTGFQAYLKKNAGEICVFFCGWFFFCLYSRLGIPQTRNPTQYDRWSTDCLKQGPARVEDWYKVV